MEADELKYLEGLEAEIKVKDGKINELGAYATSSMYGGQQQENLIVFQLELDNIMERIEHLLKGDILREDAEGNLTYTVPKDTTLIVLNDYGVQLIMNVISFYLNRNTILSNYKDDRIFEILYDLGFELADLVYINYEKMGLDTVEKRSRSSVLIMNILHMIESTYNRSLGGEERESLRTARVVTQSQPLGGGGIQMQQPMMEKKRRWSLNPFRRS